MKTIFKHISDIVTNTDHEAHEAFGEEIYDSLSFWLGVIIGYVFVLIVVQYV